MPVANVTTSKLDFLKKQQRIALVESSVSTQEFLSRLDKSIKNTNPKEFESLKIEKAPQGLFEANEAYRAAMLSMPAKLWGTIKDNRFELCFVPTNARFSIRLTGVVETNGDDSKDGALIYLYKSMSPELVLILQLQVTLFVAFAGYTSLQMVQAGNVFGIVTEMPIVALFGAMLLTFEKWMITTLTVNPKIEKKLIEHIQTLAQ